MQIFKIRRKGDGLFSTGSMLPQFNKHGKSWKLNHLKCHLTALGQTRIDYFYADAEIVVFELIETETRPLQ